MTREAPVTRIGRHRLPDGGGRKPPASVQRELRAHDNRADIRWNNAVNRWQVWRKGERSGKQTLVRTIQNRDGSYREPGADTVRDLKRGDTRRFGSVDALERAFQRTAESDAQARKARIQDRLHAISGAHFNRLAGNPVVGSTPAYRRGYELAFGRGK